jgi:hypothetical protein
MMKIYICPQCGWLRMVSRRKSVECHKCGYAQMQVSNLDLEKYTDMSEQERKDYSDAWMYIHSRKGKGKG